MTKQTVIDDGQALTIEDVCHIAKQSSKVRLCDAPAFIDRINKEAEFIEALLQEMCCMAGISTVAISGIAPLSALDTRPALMPI
jgi:histidine ammonia-lyase